MLDTIIESKPTRIMHQLADTGWQTGEGNEESVWFNAGKRLIDAPVGEIGFLPPSLIAKSRAKFFSSLGTLDEWKSRIATVAALSTCMTVAMSAAFAAPLLRLAGLPNFSLLIGGPARTGKSSTLLIATSVCGIGHEKYLLNWSGTGLGLLEAAAGFGDIVFPVNEVGAKKGKRSEAYEGLRDLFAQYAEGSDRERHSSHQPVEARRFRGICIATAERSIADYAKLADEDRDDGELFRAIDVIAVRKGKKTVLDLAPDTLDQRMCLKALRKDLEVQHGTALGPYIEHLIAMGDREVKLRIDALVREFVDHMPAAAHDNVADQMATNFGLLYAGAILGIDSGVLPWTKEHVRRTLKRGFDDALEYSKPIDHLAVGLESLKMNLREKIVERKLGSKFGPKDHAGFRKIEGDETLIVVNTSQFRSWFAGGRQFRSILEWLSSEGYLKQAEDATKGVVSQKDLDGVTLHWPNGKVVRSFVFRDPFYEFENPFDADAGPLFDMDEDELAALAEEEVPPELEAEVVPHTPRLEKQPANKPQHGKGGRQEGGRPKIAGQGKAKAAKRPPTKPEPKKGVKGKGAKPKIAGPGKPKPGRRPT
jgi:hypothetical protein